MHDLLLQLWGWVFRHPLIGVGVLLVLAISVWKQPRQTLKLGLALVVLVALGYAVSGVAHFTMSGAETKQLMIEKNQ